MAYIRKCSTVNLNAISSTLKLSLLKDYVWNNDLDFVFLQEVATENFRFLPSHNALINISSDGKGTGVLIRNSIEFSNVCMNPNGRIISVVIDDINFINIYAHSGSKYKKERDLLFSEDLLIHLSEHKENVILGDFNCIIDKNDSNGLNKNISNGLKTLVTSLGLIDIELKKNNTRTFTFMRCNSKSRLDRVYSSIDFLEKVRSLETVPVPFSDHHSIIIKFEINRQFMFFHGRGYWKMNSSLLYDLDILNKFKNLYSNLKQRNSFQNLSYWWNNDVKTSIKKFFKTENFITNQQSHREKSFYYNCLKEIIEKQRANIDCSQELALVKSKLIELEQQRLNKIKYKIKPESLQNDEKLSLYQITSFINRNTSSKQLKLRIDGRETSDYNLLRNEIFNNFSQKFKKQPVNNDNTDEILNTLTAHLDDHEKHNLAKPIEMSELETALRFSSKRSSPGPDGISYEFYTHCFDIIKNDLLKLFNTYYINEEYPPGLFTSGIITLIPKKGDKLDLQNKRPISMLNTDYKLFTKILWNRIQPILEKLIGPGQAACVKDSSCIHNLKLLRNVLIKANKSKKFKGAILSLDLEKAFDRVDHDFLWKILKKFNFPDNFISCLRKLYKNATSSVLFNGFLTSPFAILSSVRQGCPLSMVLFILYLEPLIRLIDRNLKGVLIDNNFVKVVAFADDINIFIRDDSEFDMTLHLIHYYSEYSKIKLNSKKSQFLRFNSCRLGPQQVKEVEEMKILGITFKKDYVETIEKNYKDLTQSIIVSLILQQSRRLNLFQKVTILNTFILSKLWYVAQIFPPENKHICTLRSICGKFIWKGLFYKVERKELYLPVLEGGLSLIDVEAKCKALFVKNILFSRSNDVVNIDKFMLEQIHTKTITRNTREWLKDADLFMNETHLNTCKKIYDTILSRMKITVKKRIELPNKNWQNLFENTNKNFLTSDSKSVLFMILRDIIPCNAKMFRHGVRGVESPNCDCCGVPDSVEHRIKNCCSSKKVWSWLNEILKTRFKLTLCDADELLSCNISETNSKEKAALWLTIESMCYCLQNSKSGSIEELKSHIRESRWNKRELFKKHFKHFLNLW